MKYTLTADQKAFFETHKFIEFDGFLSENELAVLKATLKSSQKNPSKKDLSKRDLSKRDLSRSNPEVQKIVRSRFFAQIALELSLQKQLRFGFDQVYELPMELAASQTQRKLSLQEMSAVRELAMGLMICVDGETDTVANQAVETPFLPFPKHPGSVIFFSPTIIWDLDLMAKLPKQSCLLIAYATSRAQYIYQENDPYNHTLKQFGYVFGDRLNEEFHPTLCRS